MKRNAGSTRTQHWADDQSSTKRQRSTMRIATTPSPTTPTAHAIRTFTTGIHDRITCMCGHDTGPCPSARAAEEVHAAHAAGTPIQAPVRPLLLGGLA